MTAVIQAQFRELVEKYAGLNLVEESVDRRLVSGDLCFSAEFEGQVIDDCFSISLVLPQEFPACPPRAFETGGRVPRVADYHVYPSSGELCLGAQFQVRMVFAERPTLVGYVDRLLVPYLYWISHWLQFNRKPWEELAHGGRGLLEAYNDYFGVSGHVATLKLLMAVRDRNFRRDQMCPCGSGRRIRNCHRERLRHLAQFRTPHEADGDVDAIIASLSRDELHPDRKRLG
jgi:hypothetical protein